MKSKKYEETYALKYKLIHVLYFIYLKAKGFIIIY